MTSQERAFHEFAEFAARLKGDEKSEAQTFLFHLLEAFNHDANTLPEHCTFEYRVRFPGQKTKFADLVWPGRVLIEMKSRGAKLSQHYQQTFDYWLNLVPHRPPYVVLCNFDELWIYDFNTQLQEPVDRLKVGELVARHSALNFLYPRPFAPVFGNNWVAVTRKAAQSVADAFNSMVGRGEDRATARRYILQSVVAMFSEDIGLLPESLFTSLLDECRRGANSYDLIGGLFRQMNEPRPARGGRFAGVDYFNGGLFATVDPVELQPGEIGLLLDAAKENWSRVQPVIFGTLFESSLGQQQRHALGAHFTCEADIQKIVRPTIVRPWEERLAAAKNVGDLLNLLIGLRKFRVLDPACGSGNFLFVAYRALRELEQNLLLRLFTQDRRQFEKVGTASGISPRQFFGLDVNDNAVETAKVTLMLARRLAARQAHEFWDAHADVLPGGDTHALQFEKDLPLDNLDTNIVCADALFTPWPEADAIIGNPPFQSKNKILAELGRPYVEKLRGAYPSIPARSDFCVYWFRRAHDHLKPGQRAGLVGTNTIRENYSREGGLDHIVQSGTITEAVSSQPWSGEANVHVSLVNWLKGQDNGPKTLFYQFGTDSDAAWEKHTLPVINSALSANVDVASAKTLRANESPKMVFVGQVHHSEGFLLTPKEAEKLLCDHEELRDVVFPYLNGEDLVKFNGPTRWVIDFGQRDLLEAMKFKAAFELAKERVMPAVLAKAQREKKETGLDDGPRQQHAKVWWKFWRPRPEVIARLGKISRYVACSSVTKRPIFEFVSSDIHPNAAVIAFTFADDYSFGVLQSAMHWSWFTAKCSTLTERFRYTSDTVFDTFPWPQLEAAREGCKGRERKTARRSSPFSREPVELVRAVAEAARALRRLRREVMDANDWSLRDLYRSLETPGDNRLRDAHAALDAAVRAAYGMTPEEDILAFLLKLNLECAAREEQGEPITPPGLPAWVPEPETFESHDCVRAPGEDDSTAHSAAAAAHFYGKEEAVPYRTK